MEGEFYHLYNRGNSKQKIFLDDEDRERFVKLLFLHNSKKNINFRDDIVKSKIDAWDFDKGKPIISIGAWVLMPNHFHILASIPHDSTSPKSDIGLGRKKSKISFFMQKMFTSYSKYFNKKYNRTGGLFETNFKSVTARTDEYLKYIFSYIHLNPVKLIDPKWKEDGIKNIQKTKNFLENYEWGSYEDYYNPRLKRIQEKILSKKDFPNYFEDSNVFREEIFDWLSFGVNQE